MDQVQRLVSLVIHAFYNKNQVIITDLLSSVNSIKEDDLAAILSVKVKEVNLICAPLVNHGLIQVKAISTDLSLQEGFVDYGQSSAKKKVSKSYYYIDYKIFIDMVKWRIHCITKKIDKDVSMFRVAFSYKCPACLKQYQMLEVNSLKINQDGFQCDLCNSLLIEDNGTNATSTTYIKFMQQIQPIVELLKTTDSLILPEYKFELESEGGGQTAMTLNQHKELAVSSESGAGIGKIVVEVVKEERKFEEGNELVAQEVEDYYQALQVKEDLVLIEDDEDDEDEFFVVDG